MNTAIQTRKEIQRIMGNLKDDGDFGPKTWAALLGPHEPGIVAKIQRLVAVEDDDTFGPETMNALRELDDHPDVKEWPPRVVPSPASALVKPLPDFVPISVSPHVPTAEPDITPPFMPLTRIEREKAFGGPFEWRRKPEPGNAENIGIFGDWEEKNIVRIEVPQLGQIPGNFRYMRVNKRCAAQFLSLWKAWEENGLLNRVLTYEGAYVPRLIRGSTTSLSNHAYGSAFDINYHWNQLGMEPAPMGKKGCVKELVPLAHKHGFYWGGNFSRRDGMHFEIAEIKKT